MVKSKVSAKVSTDKNRRKVNLVEELQELPEAYAKEEKEINVVQPDNYIFVSIGSISNIKPQLLSQESCIKFRIQFENGFVSDSPPISFSEDDDSKTIVNWQASIPCFTSRTEDLDFLTSNPVLVSIAEEDKIIKDQDVSQSTENLPKYAEFKPFAYCTLDLFPLILGESEICQTLLLEIDCKPNTVRNAVMKDAPKKEKTPKEGKSSDKTNKSTSSKSATSKDKGIAKNETTNKEFDEHEQTFIREVPNALKSLSIVQLPQISIRATSHQPIVPSREIVNESNVIFLTIESIYNVPQDFDGESMDFQAGTRIPNHFDDEQIVHFGRGVFTRESDKMRTKLWVNADHILGKSCQTHYTISDDLFSMSNKLGIDLCKVMSLDAPRIEWNRMKRSWLSSSGSEYFSEYLLKTKTMMLEVLITPRSGERKQSTKSYGDLQPVVSESMHLVAFFDVGALMFPGMHGVRVVSQLFTYCKEDVEAKCGVRCRPVLSPPAPTTDKETAQSTAHSKGGKDRKDKGKESTQGSKSSKKRSVSVRSSACVTEEASKVDEACEPRPWINEKGEPVFVIFEVELMKPLTASITKEELFAKVDALIPVIPEVPEKELAATKAGEKFEESIYNIAKKLTRKYQKFVSHRKKMNLPMNAADQQAKDFYQFLKETGVITKIKTQLSGSIGTLMKDKLGYDVNAQNEQDTIAKQHFVSELFNRLFRDTNSIINTLQSTTDESAKRYELPQEQLKRSDIEARKLGFSSLQEQMFLRQRNKANIGTQFVHSTQCDNLESAMEFTLDLLSFDKDCREGLLFYATLLTKKGEMKKAELFFQATIAKHPEYMIAGYLFSLFYHMMGNDMAAKIVWDKTRRCTSTSQGIDDGKLRSAYTELLDWDVNMYDVKSVHLKNVELFLYVNVMILDFAYMALAKELEKNGPSEPYYYYLSICHFRKRAYQEACRILQTILVEKPRLNHIRRLLGHCQFEMGSREAAAENYQFVFETSENGLQNHLVHLRLGDFYLDREDYQSAKAIFFESCKWTPTATSWLGVGIACYMQGDLAESERALTEANYLDRTVALVWGYLALINLKLYRKDKYEQCYCRAVRYNIQDDKVMGMIKDLVYACGFVIPKLIHFDNKEYSF